MPWKNTGDSRLNFSRQFPRVVHRVSDTRPTNSRIADQVNFFRFSDESGVQRIVLHSPGDQDEVIDFLDSLLSLVVDVVKSNLSSLDPPDPCVGRYLDTGSKYSRKHVLEMVVEIMTPGRCSQAE